MRQPETEKRARLDRERKMVHRVKVRKNDGVKRGRKNMKVKDILQKQRERERERCSL